MQTRFITSEEELLKIREPWNNLVAENPETDLPFWSWDWFYHSWLHFGKPSGRKPAVLVVEENETVVGLLPMVGGTKKSSGVSYRTFEFCNTGIIPRNSAYVVADRSETVFRAIWDGLFAAKNDWDILDLANIQTESDFHRFLISRNADRSWGMIRTKGLSSPFASLEGWTYDEYFTKHGNKDARRRFKRNTERFEKTGQRWEIRLFEIEDDIQHGIDLSLAVRKESWKGDFRNEEYPLFYRELFAEFARCGEVIVAVQMLDDLPIASEYIVGRKGRFFLLTNDYDTRYREIGPGACLLYKMIETAFERHWRLFDFTGESYDYKKVNCTGIRQHSTFQIFHGGWKSRFLFYAKTRLLPLLRKLLRKPQPDDLISITNHYRREKTPP